MPYDNTDGFLGLGAEQPPNNKNGTDGLLGLHAPSGAPPPFISRSGTVAIVLDPTGEQTPAETGVAELVVTPTGEQTFTDTGVTTVVLTPTGEQTLVEPPVVAVPPQSDGGSRLRDIPLLTRRRVPMPLYDEGTLRITVTPTGTHDLAGAPDYFELELLLLAGDTLALA